MITEPRWRSFIVETTTPIFTPEQMQCLMEVFGPERANSLSSRRPTAEESHEMGPCMAL